MVSKQGVLEVFNLDLVLLLTRVPQRFGESIPDFCWGSLATARMIAG